MIKTEEDLKSATSDFFKMFWSVINIEPPAWSSHWLFDGTIPNHDKRGCYALFEDKEIIYIGVAIGESHPKYQGHGLGNRLNHYWEVDKGNVDKEKRTRKYKATDDWKEVTSIMTIGFDEHHYSIAAALEVYLIDKLSPSRNKNHKPTQD